MTINSKRNSTNDVEMPNGSNNDHSSYNEHVGGGSSSEESILHKTLSHMERMEKVMTSVEEKLADMSSLERRCEELEAKCNSLENTLMNHIDKKFQDKLEDKVDMLNAKVERALKLLEKNEMMMNNQNWEYPVDACSYDEREDRVEAAYLQHTAEYLTNVTIKMRKGEFDEDISSISLFTIIEDIGHSNDILIPHMKEFAAALKQFTPVMNLLPDTFESCFQIVRFNLPHETMTLMKEALIGKPFKNMRFIRNVSFGHEYGGLTVDAIIEIAESNQHLRNLEVSHSKIEKHHLGRLCSIVHSRSMSGLVLRSICTEDNPTMGDIMLTGLLTLGELKLERLSMEDNFITDSIFLAHHLSTNPPLRVLDLSGNCLTDKNAEAIALALLRNTTLRHLYLRDNDITSRGADAFWYTFCDDFSLNTIAGLNHVCLLDLDAYSSTVNSSDVPEENRRWKIYSLLYHRHMDEATSNVEHFTDENISDVKILPNMLEAIQIYSKVFDEQDEGLNEDEDVDEGDSNSRTRCLSIVYEIMRNWEEALNLFES